MLFDQAIKDYWTIVINHLKDRFIKIGFVVAKDTFGPKSLGQFYEVRQRFWSEGSFERQLTLCGENSCRS